MTMTIKGINFKKLDDKQLAYELTLAEYSEDLPYEVEVLREQLRRKDLKLMHFIDRLER